MTDKVNKHLLKYANFYEYISDYIAIAAFPGKIIIGPTDTDEYSQSYFDEHKSLEFKNNKYFMLVDAMMKGLHYYQSKPTESFEMDLITEKKRPPLQKPVASFSRIDDDDDEEGTFQIRFGLKH